jgi:glycosylphosphatidylinositol transamidase
VYDGVNGQLPNLDLFNTAIAIAGGQLGIRTSLQEMWYHDDSYRDRLQSMLRGMVNQGLGHGTGPHSSFMPYHVDAITLQTVGNGWQDEMAMGRVVESIFRSLNNLLEHLHQSFFFYLLMSPNRFVSIGTYLPSAMLLAVNFTIMAIALWVKSGRPPASTLERAKGEKLKDPVVVEHNGMTSILPAVMITVIERHLFLPLAFEICVHSLGFVPLYLFNHSSNIVSTTRNQSSSQAAYKIRQSITTSFSIFAIVSILLPYLISSILAKSIRPSFQQLVLTKAFSLLLLGMFLSALATINFSLAFLIGLICSPLTFAQYYSDRPKTGLIFGMLLKAILLEAAFGWDVWGMWTQVVVWCVWWPAWMTGAILVASSMMIPGERGSASTLPPEKQSQTTKKGTDKTVVTKS